MRNSVAKKLRAEAGKQTSDSNRLHYDELKRNHKARGKGVEPKYKITRRQIRVGKPSITKTTLVPLLLKKVTRRKLKA